MKRLVGVLTVLDGWVVGSYGFKTWLPVGRVAHQIEELERWQVDEIAILDISPTVFGPGSQAIFDVLQTASPLTPILVGGGIASLDDASRILRQGADRVLLGSGAFNDLNLVDTISSTFGDQAVVLALPILRTAIARWCEPKSGGHRPLDDLRYAISDDWGGELLVMDVLADGGHDSFDPTLLDDVTQVIPDARVMVFGGFRSPQAVDKVLSHQCTTAVCFGNVVHQRETFIRTLKRELAHPTRPFFEGA